MERIIPRWEWRTFATDLKDVAAEIRKHPESKVRESSEIYILSETGNDNTKIRDELMDIKTLLRVNSEHLEQWTVILKAGFPIHISDLAIVYKAFNLPIPCLEKDEYTYPDYLSELIDAEPKLHRVNVSKKRSGYIIDECIVEFAEVTFNGKPWQTIAVEHMDSDLVIKTIKMLGLSGHENINYIKAMKKSIGL